MLPLEVVGPGGSLSTAGADRHALWARRQLESVLAAGYGDGGIQLRPGDYGARSLAGERLAAATAERTSFVGDGF